MPRLRTEVDELTQATVSSHEQIRHRAYDLYEQHGREDGQDGDDWLQAGSEITRVNVKAVNA